MTFGGDGRLKLEILCMNKFTRLFVLLAFYFVSLTSFADVWDGYSSDVSWYSEANSEFHIRRAAQLKGLSDLVREGNSFEGKTIYLDDDIALYHPWQPIGGNVYGSASFNGTFDAQNHKISSIKPDVSDSPREMLHYYGLFGMAGEKSVIKNVFVSGSVDISPQSNDFNIYVGGLVGSSDGRIENVQSKFVIWATSSTKYKIECLFVGGVCGAGNVLQKVKSDGEISLAFANVDWRANHNFVGGVVGAASEMSIVRADNKISAWAREKETYVGGVVGKLSKSIDNACFYGSLKVSNDRFSYGNVPDYAACGGIVGGGNADMKISTCISAPSSFETDYSGYWINPLVGDYSTYPCIGTDNYYTIPLGYSRVPGNQIDESVLTGASSLPGFDSNLWLFSTNTKPTLRALRVQRSVYVMLDKGKIGYLVEDGGAIHLKLMADEGYEVSKVYFNETDVTDLLQGDDLTLTDISSDGVIKIIFIQSASSVHMVEQASKPNLSISSNGLVLKGVVDGSIIQVYTLDGRLIMSEKVKDNQKIELKAGGYIVKLGRFTYKIAL